MKKLISLVLTCMITLTFSSSAMANQTNVKVETTKEKINNMVSDGLSVEDATYYATLDDVVKKYEKEGTKISLDNSIPNITDEEVSKNIRSFRNRVINGDKAAIKKALTSPVYARGTAEMNNIMKQNSDQKEYIIKYPDGSTIKVKTYLGDYVNNKVNPNEYVYGTYFVRTGYYTGAYAEWQFTSGVSFSTSRIICDYNVNTSANTANVTYAHGVQNSYGVVGISNSNSGVISSPTYTSLRPAEANNSVIFNVSNSFAATFGILSVSVTTGNHWTQDVYYRVYGGGVVKHVADSF